MGQWGSTSIGERHAQRDRDVGSDRLPRRRSGTAAVVVALVFAAVAAACVPPTGWVPDPYALRADLTVDGFTVSWAPTADGVAHGYEIQIERPTAPWTTFAETTASSVAVDQIAHGERVRFRMRDGVPAGTTPKEWSPPIDALYVDPVLPVVRISTEGNAPILDRQNYVRSTVTIDPNGSAFPAYQGDAGVRGRGNSTWGLPKKPYRIKLDGRSPIMGLPSERDWVLLANAYDPSQLRNFTATEMSRRTDLAYSHTMRHVEVVLNGRYEGVYTLTEHPEVGPDRVDITEMDEGDDQGVDLTGGYRLEIDARLEENSEPGFRTAASVPIVVKDPDPATPEQMAYIRNHVQQFESALNGANFTDPVLGYRRYLDVGSFVDHFLVQELTRNSDAFWASTFFTKERGDELLRFGPVWDFDLSLGNPRSFSNIQVSTGDDTRLRGWNVRLFQDPAFQTEVARRWHELRPEFSTLPDLIRTKGAELAPATANDTLRWGPHSQLPTDSPEFIADWLTARMEWMDTRYPAPPA